MSSAYSASYRALQQVTKADNTAHKMSTCVLSSTNMCEPQLAPLNQLQSYTAAPQSPCPSASAAPLLLPLPVPWLLPLLLLAAAAACAAADVQPVPQIYQPAGSAGLLTVGCAGCAALTMWSWQ